MQVDLTNLHCWQIAASLFKECAVVLHKSEKEELWLLCLLAFSRFTFHSFCIVQVQVIFLFQSLLHSSSVIHFLNHFIHCVLPHILQRWQEIYFFETINSVLARHHSITWSEWELHSVILISCSYIMQILQQTKVGEQSLKVRTFICFL